MGADLYIKDLHDKAYAKWEPQFKDACQKRDAETKKMQASDPDNYAVVARWLSTKEYGSKADMAKLPRLTPEQRKMRDTLNKFQQEVHRCYGKMNEVGYFRDSYNGTSVMWQLGLSWWTDIGKLTSKYAMGDEEGHTSIEGVKAIRELVAAKQITVLDMAKLENCSDTDTEKGRATWLAYFQKKHKRLIAFFDKAIKLNKPIRFSC